MTPARSRCPACYSSPGAASQGDAPVPGVVAADLILIQAGALDGGDHGEQRVDGAVEVGGQLVFGGLEQAQPHEAALLAPRRRLGQRHRALAAPAAAVVVEQSMIMSGNLLSR